MQWIKRLKGLACAVAALAVQTSVFVFAQFHSPVAQAQTTGCPPDINVPDNSECAPWTYHPWRYRIVNPPYTVYSDLGAALEQRKSDLMNFYCEVTWTRTEPYCPNGGFCSAWGHEPVVLRMHHYFDATFPKEGPNACQDSTEGLTEIYHERDGTFPNSVQCPPTYRQYPSDGKQWLIGDPPVEQFPNQQYACYRPPIVQMQQSATNGCLPKANPCDVLVGNKRQEEIDYRAAGIGGLSFTRVYNSLGSHPAKQNQYGAPLGAGWFGSYLQFIFSTGLSSGIAYAVRPDGMVIAFRATEPGSTSSQYVAEGELRDRLRLVVDSQGTFAGWQYVTANEDEEFYDTNGRLRAIESRPGVSQTLTYGFNNRVESVVDDFGHELTFQWDTASPPRLASITLPGGATEQVVFEYGASNNLTRVTYPDTRARTYLYELTSGGGQNLLTGIEDEAGVRYVTWGYGAGNVVTSSTHAGGADSYSITFNADGTRVVVDPLGTSRTYTTAVIAGQRRHTGSDLLCQGCGEYASATFDAFGNFESTVDFNGVETRYTYDAVRTLETSRTEAFGTPLARTTQTVWHPIYRLPALITEPGRTSEFEYDTGGNLLERADIDTASGESRRSTWTYDAYGRVLTEDGPRDDVDDVTTYTYYTCGVGAECGQIHTITNALGHVTTYDSYNAHGQPLQITDSNGVVTTLDYDARQRLIARTIAGEQTSFEYLPTGLLRKVTLPDTSFVQYTYDDAHRLVRVADSAGNYVAYTLDGLGNRVSQRVYDPADTLTRASGRVFNELNQLVEVLTASGAPTQATFFGYDDAGNQTTVNEPLGRNTVRVFDELNRLHQVTDAAGGLVQFAYDARNNLVSETDPRNKLTSYAYNGFDELIARTSPETGLTSLTYDAAGNQLTATDARDTLSSFTYDALNRTVSATYSRGGTADQTVVLAYDAGVNGNGRLTAASDENHAMTWQYDALGRVATKTQTVGAVTHSVVYTYVNGNLSGITTPSGQAIAYSFNANHQVVGITINGDPLLSGVTYEPLGPPRSWTWGNGTSASRTFDSNGNVTQVASGGRLHTLEYDDAFRIVGITDVVTPAASYTYAYDGLDRLTSAITGATTSGWTYDAVGNRLSETGATPSTYTIAGGRNRITSITGALNRAYSYNAVGSARAYGDVTMAYDDRGRLSRFTRGTTTVRYTYNAQNQLVKHGGGGLGTVHYVYDESGRLMGEYNGQGGLIQETVWLDNIPVATIRPGTPARVFYVHTDHLNTPRKVTRPSDNAARWTWNSGPFGGDLPNESPDGLNQFEYNLRFAGQIYDAHATLMHNGHREYDPMTGRYVESDPIGLAGGISTYAYAAGNPNSLMDPAGLKPWNTCPKLTYPESCEFYGFPGVEQVVETRREGTEVYGDVPIVGLRPSMPFPDPRAANDNYRRSNPKSVRPGLPLEFFLQPFEAFVAWGVDREKIQPVRSGYCLCTDRCGVTSKVLGAKEYGDPYWREEPFIEHNIW